MLCKKCGNQIGEGDLYCSVCGAKGAEAAPNQAVHSRKFPNSPESNNSVSPASGKKVNKDYVMFMILVWSTIFSVIFPFTKWIRVPLYDAIFSWSGVFNRIQRENVFFMASEYSGGVFTLLSYAYLAMIIASIVISFIFIFMGFLKKNRPFVLSLVSSIMMLTSMTYFTIFAVIITAASFTTVRITPVPFFAVLVSLANVVLTAICMYRAKR